jgi:hypothetical protein
VKIIKVMSNHARAEVVERLPLEEEDPEEDDVETDPAEEEEAASPGTERPPDLGSREDFWGN